MPTPLPSPYLPDSGGLINAARLGQQDYLANQRRDLMKEAGGLAAAGNYSGARSALFKGGEFGEARNMGAEMRAIQSHARSLDTQNLERSLKSQELLGRLAGSIKTPEQFQMAKDRLSKLGLSVDDISFEQLPELRQQALTVQQQLENEYKTRRLDIAEQKAAAKANAPQKLTQSQASARNYLGMASQAEQRMKDVTKDGASPMSFWDKFDTEVMSKIIPGFENTPMGIDKYSRRYIQNAMQFIRAKLRKESGATISPSEFEEDFRTYFPQPGDDAGTIQQKAEARKQVLRGLRVEGGLTQNVQSNELAPPDQLNNGIPDDPSQMTDEQLDEFLGINAN